MNKIRLFKIYAKKLLLFAVFYSLATSTNFAYSAEFNVASRMQQIINEKKITIDVKNKPLKEILYEIQEKGGISFLIKESNDKNLPQSLTLKVKDATIKSILDQLLAQTDYRYEIVGKTITILHKSTQQANPVIKVKGKVVEQIGNAPIAGATIIIQGTTKGAITDERGEFILDVKKGDVVEVSFAGKIPVNYIIADDKDFIITLKNDTFAVEDVVITGLFSRPKESYTGAARTFSKQELAKASSSNVFNALKSLDPSLQIPQDIDLGSNPNALPDIVVRGGNSLVDPTAAVAGASFNYSNNPNAPLFILDGFEVSLQRVNDLDMNRVANVVILKDATATTIYGSRAANGVIVIETVPAEIGRFKVTYTGNAVFEFPDLGGYNLLNAKEKHQFDLTSGVKYGVSGVEYYKECQQLIDNFHQSQIARGVDVDWLKIPLRNAIGHKHSIYIEGGDKAVTYSVSASYDKRNGVMKSSGRENTMLSSFLSYRIKNLMFKNEITLNFNKAKNSPYGNFSDYSRMNQYWSPRDENGEIPYYVEDIVAWDNRIVSRVTNPLYNATLNLIDESKYQTFTENLYGQWSIGDFLKITGRFAYTIQNDESSQFFPAQHTKFASISTAESYKRGTFARGYGKKSSMEGTLTADFNRQFGRNVIYASLGMTFQESSYSTENYSVQGFPNDRADQILMGNRYPEGAKPTGTESIKRLAGYFLNATYVYDSRYLLDVSGRYDGSSLFGRENRFAPFFSLGVGWNLHNEKFLKNVEALSRLKIRYSVGQTGSQNFESYLGVTTSKYFTEQDYRYNYGTYLMGYGNDLLSWQRTLKHNIGLDLTIANRFDLTVNYFNEISKGSVATVSVAPSTGFTSYKENMGDVTNKGWEVNANYTLLSKPEQGKMWSLFFNLINMKGEIKKISNQLEAMNKQNATTLSKLPLPRYENGRSTTAIWAVQSLGIDPGNGLEMYRKLDGTTTNTYDMTDQIVAGDTRPKIEGTFGTSFEYRGWGLNVYIRYRCGGDAYNQTLVNRVEEADLKYNVDRRVSEDRWHEPGDKVFFKAINSYGNYANTNPTWATSRFVMKDNLLSLENVSIYYRFSDAFNKRLRISNTKLTFYMSDVARLSSIKRERGLEYPFSRSFTLQLQATF